MRNNRTHRHDMNQTDIDLCETDVKTRNQWVLGDYAKNRMTQRGVTELDMALTLADGYLVEVNETQGLCVVMRRDFLQHSVCVVINSTTGFIITTWKNKHRDPSSILDMTKFRTADDSGLQVWSIESKWLDRKFTKENYGAAA